MAIAKSKGMSGQQLAADNLQKFNAWIEERDTAEDWKDYVRQGKLNRSEIAEECNFALSVLRQNPAVKAALETLENRLRDAGQLPVADSAPDSYGEAVELPSKAIDRRIMAARSAAEARVKALEEQNAGLKAEVHDLREQLGRYRHLEEHLCRTGRMLHQ